MASGGTDSRKSEAQHAAVQQDKTAGRTELSHHLINYQPPLLGSIFRIIIIHETAPATGA
jgi:hypothetical protein